MASRRARARILPRFTDSIEEWQSEAATAEDPADYLAPLSEVLSTLEQEFSGDEGAEELISLARAEIETIKEMYSGADSYDGIHWLEHYEPKTVLTERSIFDDIDE